MLCFSLASLYISIVSQIAQSAAARAGPDAAFEGRQRPLMHTTSQSQVILVDMHAPDM